MSVASILCTKCGAAGSAGLSLCDKCGGKTARVCGGCGFHNSLAKNYCDKCGNPIFEIARTAAPPPPTVVPGAPQSNIPTTAVNNILSGTQLPAAGRQAPDPFAVVPISGDPWAPAADCVPPIEYAPKPARWIALLRMSLNVAAGALGVLGSLLGVWYWNENRKPGNLASRAAVQYLEALRARNFDGAYAMFSVSAKKYCTPDEFRSSRNTSTWTWSDLRIERMESDAAMLAYELNVEGAPSRTDHILFIKEGKLWVRPFSWVLMRKVEEAFDKGDADKGMILASAAASINPRDPMAHGYLCEAAYYRKSPEETEKQCVTAIELSRAYPANLTLKNLYHLHAILADTYKNALKLPERALDQFAQMLAFPNISPADQCEILLTRAEAYSSLSRPGEALADLDRSAQLCASRSSDQAYIREMRLKLGAPQN